MLCRLCYHNGRCIKIAGLHPGKSGLLLLIRTVLPVHIHKTMTMITIFVRDCNQISQSFYDSVIYNLPFHQLACSCGHAACLSIHGYYRRTVKLPSGPLRLRVCRVKCSEFCNDYEEGRCVSSTCADNPSIDENNVKSVLRNYTRCWREKLRSLRIPLSPINALIRSCFSDYSSQFMQIHRRVNKLFPYPT